MFDVAVIGAGMAGLSCAQQLRQAVILWQLLRNPVARGDVLLPVAYMVLGRITEPVIWNHWEMPCGG
jgi:2-polyprenyl-6-methoxyphenol hydroxylase-like FAD-dependent oxidoreductase